MRIAATIVTYNRKELLRECIECLLGQEWKTFDIWIIDNGSTDGTKESISDYIGNGEVKYLNTGKNLGGAGGFNRALKIAAEQKYDYVWMMDDDTMPRKDALAEFVKAAGRLDGEWGFLSGKAVWKDGNICKMNEQKLLEKESSRKDGMIKCRQATFVSLFLPVKIVLKEGLPIKEFFIWGDDVEYTRRISEKHVCYFVPQSIVLHKTQNNEGSNIAKDSYERAGRYRYAYRNEVYIAKKEGIGRKIYQICKILYHIFRVIMTSEGKRMEKIRIIIGASVEGMRFNPQIEYVEGV